MATLDIGDFKALDGRVEVEVCWATRGLMFICADCRSLLLESSMDIVEDSKDIHLVVDALSDSVQTALAAHTCLVHEAGVLMPGRAEILEEQAHRQSNESAVALSQASRVPTRQVVDAFQALGSAGVTATEALRNFGIVAGRVTVHPHHTRVCKAARCSKCGMLTDERRLQHMGGELFCCEECIQELEAEQGSKKGLRVIRF